MSDRTAAIRFAAALAPPLARGAAAAVRAGLATAREELEAHYFDAVAQAYAADDCTVLAEAPTARCRGYEIDGARVTVLADESAEFVDSGALAEAVAGARRVLGTVETRRPAAADIERWREQIDAVTHRGPGPVHLAALASLARRILDELVAERHRGDAHTDADDNQGAT
ncbi:hypothetical protein [Nocardia sp. NPDC057455]|uniref:hypothetical protein n=1 Tax=Nocardia sp. NPDC057455 TaxID=3346138 RepID=UPI00366BBC50